jgi:hypothetical protein
MSTPSTPAAHARPHTRSSNSPLEDGLPILPRRRRSLSDAAAIVTDPLAPRAKLEVHSIVGLPEHLERTDHLLELILRKLDNLPAATVTHTPEAPALSQPARVTHAASGPDYRPDDRRASPTTTHHAAAPPKWKLARFDSSPTDPKRLVEWRSHLGDFQDYWDHYRLSESAARAEFGWTLGQTAKDFVAEVEVAFPNAGLRELLKKLSSFAGADSEEDTAYSAFVSLSQRPGEDGASFLENWDSRLTALRRLRPLGPEQAYAQLKAVLNSKYKSKLRGDLAATGSIGSMAGHQQLLELRTRIRVIAADRKHKDNVMKTIAVAPVNAVTERSKQKGSQKEEDGVCRVHGTSCSAPSWARCPDALTRARVLCRSCQMTGKHLTRDHEAATVAGASWLIKTASASGAAPASGSTPVTPEVAESQ